MDARVAVNHLLRHMGFDSLLAHQRFGAHILDSFNGRTGGSEPLNRGSIP